MAVLVVLGAHLLLAGLVGAGWQHAAHAARSDRGGLPASPQALHARIVEPDAPPAAHRPADTAAPRTGPSAPARRATPPGAPDALPPVQGAGLADAPGSSRTPATAAAANGPPDAAGSAAPPVPEDGGGFAPAPTAPRAPALAVLAAAGTAAGTGARAPAGAASAPAVAPPTYPTRPPPAARLEFELRRGAISGVATLRWLPVADRYTLSLEGSTLGLPVLSQGSEGGFDRAGLAPVRFLDRRRGRDARAANFQRDIGRIGFSGPAIEFVLLPGSQDRLSWMLQAAAIVSAAPARFVPGSELAMFVAGARGDADTWTFDVLARETIELPAGTVAGALRLKREPRKPYDTEVEVWLDPARHHLPVRLRLAVPQTGESTDFMLRAAELR